MTPQEVTELGRALAAMPRDARELALKQCGPQAVRALKYAWRLFARDKQVEPAGEDWLTWMIMAGRAFGKTRTGAEWVRERVETGEMGRIILVARTAADARDVMVEGESGIMAVSPPNFRPVYEPSKCRLTWPNGAIATTYSGEEPDKLRGPQGDGAWCDELAAWQYDRESWDNLMLLLRLGKRPRVVVTTTPRPTELIRELAAASTTKLTVGSTYENRSNLPSQFFDMVVSKYEGTRLGDQELHAKLLEDTPGALWKMDLIRRGRVSKAPDLVRKVVAIDPAVSAPSREALSETEKQREARSETGIVVAGVGPCRCKCVRPTDQPELHAFVLEDASGPHPAAEWARIAVFVFKRHVADRIVAEVNNGGNLVEANVRTADKLVPYKAVRASDGKRTRAEPVVGLYEQGRVHHVGQHAGLENQMTTWDPMVSKSPDRVDALVWAITELLISRSPVLDESDRGAGTRRMPSGSGLPDYDDE